MKKSLITIICFLLLNAAAHALFLLENNDFKRSGRSILSAGQLAQGTVINLSWGIWERSNLYIIVGTGGGLGWKQRLLSESAYLPFSWDLSAETTSLKFYHTTAYGTSLWKELNDDLEIFVKFEQIESLDQWPGLPALGYNSITSIGLTWGLWKNSFLTIQGSSNPNNFGTIAFHVLL
ncbi:hypothetical protein ACFL5G_00190 [Candidatus Margulisiibacteriota bacterium]